MGMIGEIRVPRPTTVAAAITEARMERGWSQTDLARQLHVDASIISLWERGRRLVPESRKPALAAVLPELADVLAAGDRPVPPEPPLVPPDLPPLSVSYPRWSDLVAAAPRGSVPTDGSRGLWGTHIQPLHASPHGPLMGPIVRLVRAPAREVGARV